jgi:hypothetical protein
VGVRGRVGDADPRLSTADEVAFRDASPTFWANFGPKGYVARPA